MILRKSRITWPLCGQQGRSEDAMEVEVVASDSVSLIKSAPLEAPKNAVVRRHGRVRWSATISTSRASQAWSTIVQKPRCFCYYRIVYSPLRSSTASRRSFQLRFFTHSAMTLRYHLLLKPPSLTSEYLARYGVTLPRNLNSMAFIRSTHRPRYLSLLFLRRKELRIVKLVERCATIGEEP